MTSPGGPSGITPGPIQQLFSITGGSTGTNIPGLEGLTQTPVEDALKQMYVLENEAGVGGPLGLVYNSLRAGISLPLAILEALINKLTGGSNLFLNVEHALAFAKQVPGLSELLSGILGTGDEGGIPELLPELIPADASPLAAALINLRRMLGNPALGLAGFDPLEAVANLVETLVKPTNLLAWIVPDGSGGFRLPDGLSPQLLLDLLDGVKALLSQIGLAPVIDPIANTINFLLGLIGISTSAQQAAVTATSVAVTNGVRLDALAASGTSWYTNFDGAAGASISPFVLARRLGFGAGGYQLDGSGHAAWAPGSGGITDFYTVPSFATTSDNHQATIVLYDKIPANSSMWFLVRASADGLSWVGAQVTDTAVGLVYSVAGSITYLTGPVYYTPQAGEIWKVQASGTNFTVGRNNVSLVTASSAVPAIGSAYHVPAFGVSVPSGPFSYGQGSAAILDSFAIGDIS